ncbi:unnamed protein product [Linum tenue]|uniref:Uncharacterized protein n=1 Tax=Linum tenue TaxID=586396 RepID=A0AAV0NQI8_9ROSI|nr:unnamed protein product [Linum tenue]
MGSKEAPNWADQWGSYDREDRYDDGLSSSKKDNGNGNGKMADVKAAASAGLDKAKSAASAGASKMKSGTSVGIKWVKKQCSKKFSSS